jgi:ABC-type glycerol-3-phosphate transport system substrate-binding protein
MRMPLCRANRPVTASAGEGVVHLVRSVPLPALAATGKSVLRHAVFGALLAMFSFGCHREDIAAHTIRVWAHQGQEAENKAMHGIAAAFNHAHANRGWRVELAFFPDFQFTEKVAIAAAAGDLPDVFDIDGPLVTRYVDAGLLRPLDRWVDRTTLDDFLPTIRAQGTVNGKLYALGAFDSAMALYYDREMFAAAHVTPPPEGRGWTWPEFLDACAKLRAAGFNPVAMHMNESADEWYTYAFSPLVWSGGGRLISSDGGVVRGVLASRENVRTLRAWQEVFRRGYAATDPVDPNPFDHDRTAMDWSGHWLARDHLRQKGDRLGVMPLPRVGDRRAAPCGSWCWGISARTREPELAAAWLQWTVDPRHGIEPMVRANGAVPARRSAFAAFPEFQRAPYRLFREQLEQHGHPRPLTPFYATLTRHFAAALRDIARGADVEPRLRQAENEIQKVIDRRGAGMASAAKASPRRRRARWERACSRRLAVASKLVPTMEIDAARSRARLRLRGDSP